MSNPALFSVSPVLDDWPATEDALDFAPYRDTLVEILRNPAIHTPLTIGLFGTWGSGKTSLMKMIKTEIDAARLPTYHTTWFNAWKYHREKALWRALILRVLDSVRPNKADGSEKKLNEAEQALVEDLDRLEESLYRTVEWEEIGRWTLDWFKALRGTTEGAAEIALAFVPGGSPLVNLLKQAAKAVTGEQEQAIAKAFHREVKIHRREQLRSLEQFEWEFQALLYRHVVSRGGRLIIFVDDLDRCLPERTIEVLEAMKLFLDVPGCVFVLGLDQEAIVEAIRTRYQGEVKGRQYLEKMIQLPFLLPPIETEGMRGFVDSLVPHLPDRRCSAVFAEGLPHNPRQVKRTINIFLLLWHLSRQKLPEAIQPVRLAKVVTIQHSYPSLYALLCEVPSLLRDLEVYFRAKSEAMDERDVATEIIAKVNEDMKMLSLSSQLQPFVEQPTLRRLLTMHQIGELHANFIDLKPNDIRPYIYLTRQADPQPKAPTGIPEPQMIRIPSGEFTMGTEEFSIEKPPHNVYLPEYEIGRYPVTNYEYRAFVKDTGISPPQYWEGDDYPEEMGDHPVVYVSWNDAIAYCQWLSQKTDKSYRLPTEAEWEKAARGEDNYIWPWGNEWEAGRCNSKDSDAGNTTPVGQYSPDGDSPYGVVDMSGNVWEWCSSLYKSYPYRPDDGRENLEASGDRIVRGGSFSTEKRLARSAYRYKRLPNSRDRTVGFRVTIAGVDER